MAVFANTYLFYSSFVLLLTIVIFLVFKNYAMHLLISFGKLPYKELNHVIQKRNLCIVNFTQQYCLELINFQPLFCSTH